MKVLHVLSQKPDFTGSGKYVQEMILQGRAKGHESFLVAGVSAGYSVPTTLISPENVRLVRFDGHDISFPIMGMSDVMPYPSSVCSALTRSQLAEYEIAFTRIIAGAVADFSPDIIHCNHLWMATGITRKVAPHVPLIVTCHGSCLRQHHICPDLGRSLTDRLGRVDRVIALYDRQKKEIMDLLDIEPNRVHVISGGYNQSCFYGQEKAKNTGTVHMVYAGKLATAKGVPWLLRSLRQVDGPWHLHLVGTGSGQEKKRCLRLAADLGGRVTVHGVLSHEQLGDLMRASDIFVLPSFFEGLPLVLLEALACGCAVVTTDLPGVRELFGQSPPRTVRMVELPRLQTVDKPFAADEPLLERRLADALRASIADALAGVRPDQEEVRKITKHFRWENIFARIEAVYMEVLQARTDEV